MSNVLRLTSLRRWRLARRASPTLALAFALGLLTVFADVPVNINYVGHLDGVGSSGESKQLAEKNLLMVFRLYDVPGTGATSEKTTALWGRQASVSLTDGDFDVDLADNFGSVVTGTAFTSLADALADAGTRGVTELYLGLTAANDNNAEIWPRQKLTAVPKALQALYVENVPNNFTATGGTFTVAQGMEVTGASTLSGGATYGSVAIPVTSSTSFRGGIAVAGTLKAGSVAATTVKADTVAAGRVETTSAAAVTVTGRLEAVGTPTWDGAFAVDKTAFAAGTVRGDVTAYNVAVETLSASNLVKKNDGVHLDDKNASWRIVGAITEAKDFSQYQVDNVALTAWNSYSTSSKKTTSRYAVLEGIWTAPCDCIAYIQTEIVNNTSDSAIEGAGVQFYIVESATATDFSNRKAVGYASSDKPGTVKAVVPVILCRGDIVKWLGYNGSKDQSTGLIWYDAAKVTTIRYQPFTWR